MFHALILICSMTTSGPDCTSQTALATISGQSVPNDMACIQQSQIEMAKSADKLPAESFLKVQCVHERVAGAGK